MKASAAAIGLIKSSEGCSLTSYVCSGGVLTIGYGHTGPNVFATQIITQSEADTLLRLDVSRFEAAVERTCPETAQCQFDACVSLAYNIGPAAFAKSSVARLHNLKRYAEAAQAFMLWNKAAGKVSRGLQSRRAKESALYLESEVRSDEYYPPSTAEGEKPLAQSRTLKSQIGAGVMTTATVASVSVIDKDTVGSIIQFLPYLKDFWWLFAIVAVGYLAWGAWARISDRREGRS
jgi:lysozyme